MFITFLSDFGLKDDFVGTCHGVIKRIAPEAQIIDITHGIEPQAVLQGALVLASTLPYMPEGVHLAVVDPGVGGDRRALALRDASGRLYVGPDNGLLVPAAEKLGGIDGAWQLTNSDYMLEPVSATFHGRDVFSPAAAHLAPGVDPAELGPGNRAGVARAAGAARARGRRRARSAPPSSTLTVSATYSSTWREPTSSRAGIVPGRRLELDLGFDAVLRDRGAGVLRRAGGRHHPLRGRVREHRRRDHGRQRRGDVLDPARRRPDDPRALSGFFRSESA